jgi:hypothetical protein
MAQDAANAQKKAGFAQMVGGAAMSYAMPGLMGGLTKKLAGAGGKNPLWGDKIANMIAQPHLQNMNISDAAQMNLMRQLHGEGKGGQSFASSYNLQRPSYTPGSMFNTQGSFGQGLMNYGMQNMQNRNAGAYSSGFGQGAPNPYALTPNFHQPAPVVQQNNSASSMAPGYDPNWTY